MGLLLDLLSGSCFCPTLDKTTRIVERVTHMRLEVRPAAQSMRQPSWSTPGVTLVTSIGVLGRISADTARTTRRLEPPGSDVETRTVSDILDAWGDARQSIPIMNLTVELAVHLVRGACRILHAVPVGIRVNRKALCSCRETIAARVTVWLVTLPEAAHLHQYGGSDLAAVSMVHPGVLEVHLIIDWPMAEFFCVDASGCVRLNLLQERWANT